MLKVRILPDAEAVAYIGLHKKRSFVTSYLLRISQRERSRYSLDRKPVFFFVIDQVVSLSKKKKDTVVAA